MIAGYYRSQI